VEFIQHLLPTFSGNKIRRLKRFKALGVFMQLMQSWELFHCSQFSKVFHSKTHR